MAAVFDTTDGSYYPSAKVRLGIRFDEMARRVFTGKIPPRPLKYLAGVKDPAAPLKATLSTDNGERVWVLDYDLGKKSLEGKVVGQTGFVTSGPQKAVSSTDGLTHVIAGILPREATWGQNGIRIADTLSLTLRYIDCPIDPRTIRSCWVEFYLGTVSQEDFAAGISGVGGEDGAGGRFIRNANGDAVATEAMNLIPDDYVDPLGNQRTNLRFQGFIDKWTTKFDESGEPLIVLEARDNTQMLIDTEAPAKLRIDAKIPIDQAFAQYLTHFPQFAGLQVEYRPGSIDPSAIPVLQQALTKTAFQPRLGPAPGLMAGAPTGLSVWDFLTDVAGSVGHGVRVVGNSIIIQRTRTLYASETGGTAERPDDPFIGRNGQLYRQFIYGRNLLSMESERSFVRTAPKNIEVRSYSPSKKQVVVGRYPTNITGSGIQTSIPGDGGAEEEWLVWRVSGIEDPKILRVIAQNVYESLGRQELTQKFKTRSLASFGGDNLDPDIFDMEAGDTFELLVNRGQDTLDPTTSDATFTTIERALAVQQGRAVDFLRTLGFDNAFADAYAKVYTDLGFQTTYKTKNITCHWSVDSGVDIDLEGVNYVEVRADPVNLPNGNEVKL